MKYKLYNVKSEKAYKNYELRANHMNTGVLINTCNKLVKPLPSLTVCQKPQTLAPKDYLIDNWTPDTVKKQKASLPLNDELKYAILTQCQFAQTVEGIGFSCEDMLFLLGCQNKAS